MIRDIGLPGYRATGDPLAPTLGNTLQDAGYRTFISGKWHLGTPDPTKAGFEEFYGRLPSSHNYWDPSL
jgi:arylsulfatase